MDEIDQKARVATIKRALEKLLIAQDHSHSHALKVVSIAAQSAEKNPYDWKKGSLFMSEIDPDHIRRVEAVTTGVTKLSLLPAMTPEAVFEGAVRAAAIVMLATREVTADYVAEMLRDMASGLENLDEPNLSLVKS